MLMRRFLVPLVLAFFAQSVAAQSYRLNHIVGGLDTPWAVELLPNGQALVTERDGALLLVENGRFQKVLGVPDVVAAGQGGLLDVMIPRDFSSSRDVFLTFSKKQGRGSGSALAVGKLSADGRALNDVQILFESAAGASGGRHFGSRVVEASDGTLFVTIGDRGDRPSAQDRSNHNGTIVRINRDGSVPKTNPFVGQAGIRPEIWSYGHRNPQGAGLDAQGRLWTSEHGARGGDEVNQVKKGANFGWPIISYGRHYSGRKIGEGVSKSGMEQPKYYWDPSIAPSGLLVHSGKGRPDWRGDIFVGSLKFDYIARLEGAPLQEVERIQIPETERVRDLIEGPDGSIWFVSVGNGAVYQLVPN